jgi:hypothetical protein
MTLAISLTPQHKSSASALLSTGLAISMSSWRASDGAQGIGNAASLLRLCPIPSRTIKGTHYRGIYLDDSPIPLRLRIGRRLGLRRSAKATHEQFVAYVGVIVIKPPLHPSYGRLKQSVRSAAGHVAFHVAWSRRCSVKVGVTR